MFNHIGISYLFLLAIVPAGQESGLRSAGPKDCIETPSMSPAAARDKLFDVFSKSSVTRPIFFRIVLRFSDDPSQYILTVFAEGKSELVVQSFADPQLNRLLSEIAADCVSKDEIARRAPVLISRREMSMKHALETIAKLKQIRLPAQLQTRVSLDEYDQFVYIFESGGEAITVRINGPFQTNRDTDKLVKWMLDFRKKFKPKTAGCPT
jgi:hypothetical protein